MSLTLPGRLFVPRLGGVEAFVGVACGFILGCPTGRNEGTIQPGRTVARSLSSYQPGLKIPRYADEKF